MYYLKPQKLDIHVGKKYVVAINKTTAQHLDLHPADRVQIKNGKQEIIALVEIASQIKPGTIGIYNEAWAKLKFKPFDRRVSVSLANKPISVVYIREKLDGQKLSKEKMNAIIKDITEERLSDIEITYFVAACYSQGLSDDETVNLTQSIVNNGSRLSFDKKQMVVDKHCIGGVPGNRTTLITVPITAAAGLLIPKTSSRAITSPAGTADTMEVLANVINDSDKLMKIVKKVGGFITWGGGVDLAPADDHMISVRNPLSLDPQGMLLASILAKKASVGATHVIIDIPYGPQVKVANAKAAEPLKKRFETIAKKLGMKMKVLVTDGTQPIGDGIGPILECIDCLKVLKNDPTAPKDLRKKALMIAGEVMELTGKAKKGKGVKMAEELLTSGKAYAKFQEMIVAQGKKNTPLTPGKFTAPILSPKKGKVTAIDNKLISRYARMAGAPMNMGAGVVIHKKIGDLVTKGTPLFTVYTENKTVLKNTIDYIKIEDCYQIKA